MGSETAVRAWMLPDEPVAVRLMTTIWADTAGVHDDLDAPADLDAWLDAVGVDRHGATATQEGLDRARGLRDSVRSLAAFVTNDERPWATPAAPSSQVSSSRASSRRRETDEAIAVVNATASELPRARLRLNAGDLELATDAAASPVVAGLAGVAVEAQHLLGEDAAMLRACYAPGCVLYFVKTHPRREWCSTACGNRARAARHYQTVRSARAAK